jgi:hypothetical protein
MLNSVCIAGHAQTRAQNPTTGAPAIYASLEFVFGFVFTGEIALRFYAFRMKFFKMKGWQWNVFDLLVVSLQDAETLMDLLMRAGGDAKEKMGEVSFLKMLRLGRVVRLLRMVKLIPELKSMVYLIAASMQSFLWTMVLLALLMFGVAVHLTEVVADYRQKLATDEFLIHPGDETMLEDGWGSLMGSVTTLYQAILGGIDWKEVMDELKIISWSPPVLFAMYIAFGSLVMLNLVTGVFVEGAQRIVSEDRDLELVKQARKVFNVVDDSDNSEISWLEFEAHMADPGMAQYFKLLGMSRKDAKDLFTLLDSDHSGSLSVKEFVSGCLNLRGAAKSLDLARMAFNSEQFGTRLNEIQDNIEKLRSASSKSKTS